MEAEAPLLFHAGFSVVMVLCAVFLFRWSRGRRCWGLWAYLGLQIPVYLLVFYSLAMAAASEDRSFSFGLAGVLWAISILVLMQSLKELLGHGEEPSKITAGEAAPGRIAG